MEATDGEPDASSGILGTVLSSVFLGLSTHFFVRTDQGQEIEVIQQEHAGLVDGARVTLRVRPEKINVFHGQTRASLIRGVHPRGGSR